MRLKLKMWDISTDYTDKIIAKLTEEGFVDEKRFAVNYAGGKFRINGWGKLKIAASLRTRSIPTEFIQYALSLIGSDEYTSFLELLLQKKLKQLGGNTPKNRQKAIFFAASRGFEPGVIAAVLNDSPFNE
jgi:regulatory protein